jgi:hypothetical protein
MPKSLDSDPNLEEGTRRLDRRLQTQDTGSDKGANMKLHMRMQRWRQVEMREECLMVSRKNQVAELMKDQM